MTDIVFLHIKHRFRPDMTERDLYEAVRGEWRIGGNRDNVRYALAVAHGQVRGIYRVQRWEPVGDRWRFVGERADDLWNECVGREKVMPQNPVVYGELGEFLGREQPNEEKGVMTKEYNKNLRLLRQFGQIIFHGPPGTGKTYSAKGMLAELFGADNWELLQGDRWDIVQFHPSYNYEDFVRGVQVKTENEQVVYETVHRIFSEMCERANGNSGESYALIIDEINRANVSAVLGELIYALEYRGDKVQTPYLVSGKRGIVVPKNLFIIGTMNTADRTIGQIDYAVRRRFAFVHCPPNADVIEDGTAREFFDDVDALFAEDGGYMSADFEADDLRIGHSYFLASGAELGNKIIYQVVPILREYVRDGVLLSAAAPKIAEIEERAKKLFADESEDSSADDEEETQGGKRYFYWRNGDRHGEGGVVRTALGVITDFIKQHPEMDAAALQQEFSSLDLGRHNRIALKSEIPPGQLHGANARYFGNDAVSLQNGDVVCVSNQWGATGQSLPQWNEFKEKMAAHGYVIGLLE